MPKYLFEADSWYDGKLCCEFCYVVCLASILFPLIP